MFTQCIRAMVNARRKCSVAAQLHDLMRHTATL